MVLEFHLQIESCKLTEMSVCVGVFRAEDRSDLKYSLQVTTKRHLFVELGRLGEAGILVEILEAEHVSTAFRCTS